MNDIPKKRRRYKERERKRDREGKNCKNESWGVI